MNVPKGTYSLGGLVGNNDNDKSSTKGGYVATNFVIGEGITATVADVQGLGNAVVADVFTSANNVGAPVTVNGETFQKLTSGVINLTTGKFVDEMPANSAFSAGKITEVEAGKYTLGSDDFSAFLSARLAQDGKNDFRVIFAADTADLDYYRALNVVLTFTKDGETVKTLTKDLASKLNAYTSATAAGNTYTVAEGSVLFGLVITNVPVDAWDSVSVELVDRYTGDIAAYGSQYSENVMLRPAGSEVVIEAGNYGIETHHAGLDYHAAWVLNLGDNGDLYAKIDSKFYTAKVLYNGTEYTIEDLYNQPNWIRMDLETAGLSNIKKGDVLKLTLKVYDGAGNLRFVTNELDATASGFSTDIAAVNVELPANLTKKDVDTTKISTENIGVWSAEKENVAQLFDGNTSSSKLGGNVTDGNKPVVVNFALTEEATLTYYTIYTGNDTAGSPARNPKGWNLYGKVNGEWVLLDSVGVAGSDGPTGLKAVNGTPFSYKIDAPVACTEYKIEFEKDGSQFQLNELELYVG